MPIAGYPDFETAVQAIAKHNNPHTGKPYGIDVARKIVGAMESRNVQELEKIMLLPTNN